MDPALERSTAAPVESTAVAIRGLALDPSLPRRLALWIGVSATAHALALAVLLSVRHAPVRATPVIVLPVSLVARAGGGGGDGGAPAPAAEEPPSPPPVRAAEPTRVAAAEPVRRPAAAKPRARPAPPREQPAADAAPTGVAAAGGGAGYTAQGGTGTGGTGGDGSGGDGSGGAQVAYGENPAPTYPLAARRLGLEGVVLLTVMVGPDGRPLDVSVERSSGHAVLDESAVDTVRSRWRFVPARRDGAPIASRVTVPIRFKLTGAG
jgi:periplasmic protein TonB